MARRFLLPLLLLHACATPVAVGYAPGTTPEQRDALHRETPPPVVEEPSDLVAVTVEEVFEVPLSTVDAWFVDEPLEDVLRGTGEIPAVLGTVPLSAGWGTPGDRRRVELADDSTALEQVLANEMPGRFHYVVWNYTSDAARYVDYGVGEFRFVAEGERTRVEWTYAFKPKKTIYGGPLRRFVESDYRTFMVQSLGNMKASVEAPGRHE